MLHSDIFVMIPSNVISWCTSVGSLITCMSRGQLYAWTKLGNGVYTKVINFVVSPHMAALLDSFSMLVLE